MAKKTSIAVAVEPEQAPAAMSFHDQLQEKAGETLGAFERAKVTSRKRTGLNSDDIRRAVNMLLDRAGWFHVKQALVDIEDSVLESWKDELYARAANPAGKPRMPGDG